MIRIEIDGVTFERPDWLGGEGLDLFHAVLPVLTRSRALMFVVQAAKSEGDQRAEHERAAHLAFVNADTSLDLIRKTLSGVSVRHEGMPKPLADRWDVVFHRRPLLATRLAFALWGEAGFFDALGGSVPATSSAEPAV